MRAAKFISLFLTALILLTGTGFWLYQRPLPAVPAQVIIPSSSTSAAIQIPWPSYGQAAIGATGFGILDSNNTSQAVPIASVAKAVTALALLKEKPLQPGQQGPTITITQTDVQIFNDYLAKQGSVIPVNVGQKISQYQALQALMLPSANNIADTLARWAFGSVSGYATYASRFVQSLGMTQTQIADASGFSAETKSTAKDLVVLAEAVLKNPVLANIVSQVETDFPEVGTIRNVNWLLNTDGVIGIKTGQTDEAGGCFLFGAKRTVAGQNVTVIGAVLGAPDRNQAIEDSRKLIALADSGFELATATQADQVVGRYSLPWGGSVEAVTSSEIKVLNWRGRTLQAETKLTDLSVPISQNSAVGSVKAGGADDSKSVNVLLKQSVEEPSWMWRIFR